MQEISVDELKKRLDRKDNLVLLDVRESSELQYGRLPESKQIPLGQLEARYQELNKTETHVVYCRTGGRSSRACAFLAQKGFNASNLKGGILAWKKYDPRVQEY